MLSCKGLVALLWSFSGFFIFRYLYYQGQKAETIELPVIGDLKPSNLVIPSLLLCCISGWLADMKFGRYKFIKWSWVILWILSTIFCILSILDYYGFKYAKIVFFLWYLPLSITLGGLIVNLPLLGIDQLAYASSREITSFLRWLLWLWFLSGVVELYLKSCLEQYKVYSYLCFPIASTLAISLDFLFHDSLEKEPPPPVSNSFRIIFKVLAYARKNKYPKPITISEWDEKNKPQSR